MKYDQKQQEQIDTLIQEDIEADKVDVLHTARLDALRKELNKEVADRTVLDNKHSTLRTDHTNLDTYAQETRRIHNLLDTRTTDLSNNTTKFLNDISSSLLQRESALDAELLQMLKTLILEGLLKQIVLTQHNRNFRFIQ